MALCVGEAGRQPHRRSRSIETLGPGGDAREAYRMQLERIGSMDRNSDTGRSAATTYTGTLSFTAVSTCAIGMQQDSLTRTSVLHGRVARLSVRLELTWAVKNMQQGVHSPASVCVGAAGGCACRWDQSAQALPALAPQNGHHSRPPALALAGAPRTSSDTLHQDNCWHCLVLALSLASLRAAFAKAKR